MIKLFQILCFTLCVFGLQAQKVKLKDYKVKAEHVNLPRIGFAPNVTTYTCLVECNENTIKRYGGTPASMASRVKIKGYTKVEGGGSVSLILNLGTPSSSSRETRTQTKEDKDKKKYKLYNYFFDLDMDASYKIVDTNGSIISESSVQQKEQVSTGQHRTMAALQKEYKEKYPAAKTKAMKGMLDKAISEINNRINRDFSVGKFTSIEYFVGIKSKGHPDLSQFDKTRKTVEAAFKKMTIENNDAFLEAIQPAVKFWTEKEPTYSTTDKQAKKLNYACRKNAAQAYFWMEDFDNAIKYASMIAEGNHNPKKGKKLKEFILKTKKQMDKLNFTTRHFKVKVSAEDEANIQAYNADQEAIYGSGDIKTFPEFDKAMGVRIESAVMPGKMFHKTGKVSEGYFVYIPEQETPPFWTPRRIKFGMADGKKIKTGNPVYKGLDSLLIGEMMYRIKPVKLGEGIIALKLQNAIVEEVKTFGRTRLEIIHPPFVKGKGIGGSELELESTLAIWHFKKEKHFSPDGMSFYKGMKKGFGDCPASLEYLDNMKNENKKRKLIEKLEGGAYDVKDLHQILNLYESCK